MSEEIKDMYLDFLLDRAQLHLIEGKRCLIWPESPELPYDFDTIGDRHDWMYRAYGVFK
jgi:hypothetical protein